VVNDLSGLAFFVELQKDTRFLLATGIESEVITEVEPISAAIATLAV
jgi:hypothetical protein